MNRNYYLLFLGLRSTASLLHNFRKLSFYGKRKIALGDVTDTLDYFCFVYNFSSRKFVNLKRNLISLTMLRLNTFPF